MALFGRNTTLENVHAAINRAMNRIDDLNNKLDAVMKVTTDVKLYLGTVDNNFDDVTRDIKLQFDRLNNTLKALDTGFAKREPVHAHDTLLKDGVTGVSLITKLANTKVPGLKKLDKDFEKALSGHRKGDAIPFSDISLNGVNYEAACKAPHGVGKKTKGKSRATTKKSPQRSRKAK